MLTTTGLKNLYAQVTDSSTTTATNGLIDMNDSIRTICSIRNGDWWFLESLHTQASVASQQGYEIPNNARKLIDVYNVVGTTTYWPRAIFDPNKWKVVLSYNLGDSDVPLFYYRQGNKVLFVPTPASTAQTINMRVRLQQRDLSIDDYTTGTITSITNGAKALVGSGTTWTADMVGRFIRITQTTAAGGGDGFWYEIAAFTDATHITLVKPYQGTTLAAATAAYTIGQVPIIPEQYQRAIIYRAAALYWENHEDPKKAKDYWNKYDGGYEAGLSNDFGGLIGQMLQESSGTVEGAYIPPDDLRWYIDPNIPPQDASGF